MVGLADGGSVKPELLLSDGDIVTPQMLNHAQSRQQTLDCVVEEEFRSPCVILYKPTDQLFCITEASV